MADAQPNVIVKFFSNITPEKRAERWLIFHVFALTILTFWVFAYTQVYITQGHDIVKLAKEIKTNSWAESKYTEVLEKTFSNKEASYFSLAGTDKATWGKQLNKYLVSTCLPIWELVEHEQTWFRLILLVGTVFYGVYALVYLYKVAFKKEPADLSPMEKTFEVTIWTVTQLAEVFLITFGVFAWFTLYQNSLTPGTFNLEVFYENNADGYNASVPAEGLSSLVTKDDTLMYIPNDSHCFKMDQHLGHSVWGKHTPFIFDKLLNDGIISVVIFILVFFRYILTATHIFNYPANSPVKFGIMGRQEAGIASGYPGAPYNVVAMR